MARGWESKSVESQMEEAELASDGRGRFETEDELKKRQERDSLMLSRKRVVHDLEQATHPTHRKQLELALHHLDEKLGALGQ